MVFREKTVEPLVAQSVSQMHKNNVLKFFRQLLFTDHRFTGKIHPQPFECLDIHFGKHHGRMYLTILQVRKLF